MDIGGSGRSLSITDFFTRFELLHVLIYALQILEVQMGD